MSRYPIRVTRDDGKAFLLVTGTDHASLALGQVPHCFAQILGEGIEDGETVPDSLLWGCEALTPDALVAALDANPVMQLGHFRGPYEGPPPEKEEWLTVYAKQIFQAELEGMTPSRETRILKTFADRQDTR